MHAHPCIHSLFLSLARARSLSCSHSFSLCLHLSRIDSLSRSRTLCFSCSLALLLSFSFAFTLSVCLSLSVSLPPFLPSYLLPPSHTFSRYFFSFLSHSHALPPFLSLFRCLFFAFALSHTHTLTYIFTSTLPHTHTYIFHITSCTAATAGGEGRLTGTRGRCISPTTPPTASPRSPKKSLPVAAVSKVAVRPLLFQCDTTSSEDVRMAQNHGGIRGEQERGKNEVPALFGGYCCKVHDSCETDDDGVICRKCFCFPPATIYTRARTHARTYEYTHTND